MSYVLMYIQLFLRRLSFEYEGETFDEMPLMKDLSFNGEDQSSSDNSDISDPNQGEKPDVTQTLVMLVTHL